MLYVAMPCFAVVSLVFKYPLYSLTIFVTSVAYPLKYASDCGEVKPQRVSDQRMCTKTSATHALR